jgi:hypothetical protein
MLCTALASFAILSMTTATQPSPAAVAGAPLPSMAVDALAHAPAFILVKDTSKPGSGTAGPWVKQREPPAPKPPKPSDMRKTGGIPASVVAPKPKPR